MRIKRFITKWTLRGAAVGAEDNYDRERSSLPEHRIERIRIYGQPAFVADVNEALSELEGAYPYGYSLVQRYIRGIVESDTAPSRGISNAVVYRESTPEGTLGFAPNRFGAFLVRRAVAARKELVFHLARSLRSELASLNRELHAMTLLKCDFKYFGPLLNQISEKERRLREGRCVKNE